MAQLRIVSRSCEHPFYYCVGKSWLFTRNDASRPRFQLNVQCIPLRQTCLGSLSSYVQRTVAQKSKHEDQSRSDLVLTTVELPMNRECRLSWRVTREREQKVPGNKHVICANSSLIMMKMLVVMELGADHDNMVVMWTWWCYVCNDYNGRRWW